jgi:putative sigma-54 modulation protein
MNVSYKGLKTALPAPIQARLDRKFAKLSKLLEKRGEREAHVVVTAQKGLHRAEITIQFYDHQLVGLATHADPFLALSEAIQKIEAQAVKQREKWREKGRRGASPKTAAASLAGVSASSDQEKAQRVYRVRGGAGKPVTLDEAMIQIDGKKKLPYVSYVDAESGKTSVLIRRADGHFDLIEGI